MVKPLLYELSRQHLLTAQRADRYVFSGLIRAYSSELAGIHDSATDRRAARIRLARYLKTFSLATEEPETGA